jgi:hypothetical protein
VRLISIGGAGLSVMRVGRRSHLVISLLGTAIALIAKDFTVPLIGVAMLGVFDRLVATPLLHGRETTEMSG